MLVKVDTVDPKLILKIFEFVDNQETFKSSFISALQSGEFDGADLKPVLSLYKKVFNVRTKPQFINHILTYDTIEEGPLKQLLIYGLSSYSKLDKIELLCKVLGDSIRPDTSSMREAIEV